MNDLISRKALIEEYDRVHIGPPGGARKLMEDAPAVDAVPVVHGRWWSWRELFPNKFSLLRFAKKKGFCSNCGSFEKKNNYCPFCGAKMNGGNEE